MAVNHYFQSGNGIGNVNEQRLHEDLIIEGLKIYGFDCYYLPRTLVNRDLILGEDTLSKFDDSHLIEMYMETTEGFAGQQELINKFGLEIREDTTFTVAKRRWQDAVDNPATLIVEGRPNEGDIIYMPLMKSFFEVQFVEDQQPFFQLGNLPVYKLQVTRWEYSSERLDTGITEIDEAEDNYSLDQLAHQQSLESGTFGAVLGSPVVSGDIISSIPIVSGGEGYVTAPTITISDPSASIQATATASIVGNTLDSFTITNAGRGYGSAPTVTVVYTATDSTTKTNTDSSPGLTNGQLTSITPASITDILSITSVTVSGPGDAVTATATANLTDGVVTSISITVDGSSYLGLSPTVTISENTDATGSLVLENDSVTGEVNYFLLETYDIQTQANTYGDNDDFDTEAGFTTASTADDIIDFSERNPFGDLDL